MQPVIDFIVAHSTVLAALGVAVLDLLFALNPNLIANGILHSVFVALSNKAQPPAAPKA